MTSIARSAWAALVLAAATLIAPAGAQAPPDGDCLDDHGVDRCDPKLQARSEALFGAPSLEALRTRGAQVRRAFFVDGYGRDVALVTFARERSGEPRLIVTLPPAEGRPRVLEARLAPAAWTQAIRPVDLAAAPPLRRDDDAAVRICFHGWMARVEDLDGAGRVQRRTGQACADSLPFRLGFELAELAVEALPACAALDPEGRRNAVMRLVGCGQLEGDRRTAAAARNWLDGAPLLAPSRSTSPGEIAPLLAEDAVLRWADEREVVGREAVAASWLHNMTKEPEPDFWATRYRGASTDEAVVEGRFRYWSGDKTETPHEAPARLTLRRAAGAEFRLRRIEVGAFQKVAG